ncbi:MAG: glucans biosynthesis glucosyltransferase MdoH, partial [Ferruginibacter sp.]|nr:glucans biosynthesis glucosyltransferase MdoH [Rhodoferax sp.]
KLLGSTLLEAVMSMLQAPLRMAAHSLFVLGALTGWRLEWTSPPREASDLPWADAAHRFGPLGLAVASLLGAVAWFAPDSLLWLLPMGLPLLLAVPFTVLSSRVGLGQRLQTAGWLLVPEETRSPAVLKQAWRYAHGPRTTATPWLADLPRLAALALQALGPRHTGLGLRGEQRRQRVLQLSRTDGAAPSPAEHMRFLSEPHSLRLLHAALAGERAH